MMLAQLACPGNAFAVYSWVVLEQGCCPVKVPAMTADATMVVLLVVLLLLHLHALPAVWVAGGLAAIMSPPGRHCSTSSCCSC